MENNHYEEFKQLYGEINATFEALQKQFMINHYLGHMVEDFFQHREEAHTMSPQTFVRQASPKIHKAIDTLHEFSAHIEQIEQHYNTLLDHPHLDIPTKIKIEENLAKHVETLKDLHGRQRDAVSLLTKLFLSVSREHMDSEQKK